MSKRKRSQIAPTRGDLKKVSNSGKPKMTLKTLKISRGNLNDAIELFLRQNSIIDDDQTMTALWFVDGHGETAKDNKRNDLVTLTVQLKQEATVITHNGT